LTKKGKILGLGILQAIKCDPSQSSFPFMELDKTRVSAILNVAPPTLQAPLLFANVLHTFCATFYTQTLWSLPDTGQKTAGTSLSILHQEKS